MIQPGLPFPHSDGYGRFFAADSNAEALAWLKRAGDWPQGRLALWGEAGCGKTHLLRLWRLAPPLAGERLDRTNLPGLAAAPDLAKGLAIDRADRVPDPRTLLHLLNAAAESGGRVLLAGRTPPARWNTGLPDLDSRLRAMLAVAIGPPEDSLLEALLRQLLAERQMQVSDALQDWVRLRLPRTAQAMRDAAALLDAASWQDGGRVTRTHAAEVVAALTQAAAGDEDLTVGLNLPSSAAVP